MYLVRILVPVCVVAIMMVVSVSKTGGFRFSAFIMLLFLGCLVPLSAILDGIKAKSLKYAATDRRLICQNGSQFTSVYYDNIDECRLKTDDDGQTSLLCGKKAVKSKPSQWRGKALFTGEPETDTDNHIKAFVLYAVNHVDELKQVLTGRIGYTEA